MTRPSGSSPYSKTSCAPTVRLGRAGSVGSLRAVTERSVQPLTELVGTPFRSSVKSGELPFDHSLLPDLSEVVTTPVAPVFQVRVIRPSVRVAVPLAVTA